MGILSYIRLSSPFSLNDSNVFVYLLSSPSYFYIHIINICSTTTDIVKTIWTQTLLFLISVVVWLEGSSFGQTHVLGLLV